MIFIQCSNFLDTFNTALQIANLLGISTEDLRTATMTIACSGGYLVSAYLYLQNRKIQLAIKEIESKSGHTIKTPQDLVHVFDGLVNDIKILKESNEKQNENHQKLAQDINKLKEENSKLREEFNKKLNEKQNKLCQTF